MKNAGATPVIHAYYVQINGVPFKNKTKIPQMVFFYTDPRGKVMSCSCEQIGLKHCGITFFKDHFTAADIKQIKKICKEEVQLAQGKILRRFGEVIINE